MRYVSYHTITEMGPRTNKQPSAGATINMPVGQWYCVLIFSSMCNSFVYSIIPIIYITTTYTSLNYAYLQVTDGTTLNRYQLYNWHFTYQMKMFNHNKRHFITLGTVQHFIIGTYSTIYFTKQEISQICLYENNKSSLSTITVHTN